MAKNPTHPTKFAERVRTSEARKIQAGGRRIPGGVLTPEAASALESLQRYGYSNTATGCITRALLEAELTMKALVKPHDGSGLMVGSHPDHPELVAIGYSLDEVHKHLRGQILAARKDDGEDSKSTHG